MLFMTIGLMMPTNNTSNENDNDHTDNDEDDDKGNAVL